MSKQFSMAAMMPPVELFNNAADSAGRTGSYRSLKDAIKAYVVVKIAQGNAATVLLSLLQASDKNGTGSKAVNAVPIWSNLDTAAAGDLTSRTAGATYTTDAGLKNKYIVFEILPEAALDVANGFDYITVSTGASNAANVTSADLYVLHGTQQATPPDTYA